MAQKCTGCGRLNTEPLGLNKNGEPYLACCPDNSYKDITSVEWLVEKLEESGIPLMSDEIKMIEQAKEMNKAELKDAFMEGSLISKYIIF